MEEEKVNKRNKIRSITLEKCSETQAIYKQGQIISSSESYKLEFKNYTWPFTFSPNHDLELIMLKTICSFLNRDGGTILIGVNDAKQVIGLTVENVDEVKRYFDMLKERFYPKPHGLIKTVDIPLYKNSRRNRRDSTIEDNINTSHDDINNKNNNNNNIEVIPNRYMFRIQVKQGQIDRFYTFKNQGLQIFSAIREDASAQLIRDFDQIQEHIYRKCKNPSDPADPIIYSDPHQSHKESLSNINRIEQQQYPFRLETQYPIRLESQYNVRLESQYPVRLEQQFHTRVESQLFQSRIDPQQQQQQQLQLQQLQLQQQSQQQLQQQQKQQDIQKYPMFSQKIQSQPLPSSQQQSSSLSSSKFLAVTNLYPKCYEQFKILFDYKLRERNIKNIEYYEVQGHAIFLKAHSIIQLYNAFGDIIKRHYKEIHKMTISYQELCYGVPKNSILVRVNTSEEQQIVLDSILKIDCNYTVKQHTEYIDIFLYGIQNMNDFASTYSFFKSKQLKSFICFEKIDRVDLELNTFNENFF